MDISGGAGALITLAARLISNSSKSTTNGTVTPLGSGFGQTSRFDVVMNFLVNKTTPAAGAVVDMLKGQARSGGAPTPGKEIYGALTPIAVQNIISLKNDHSASAVLGVIADGLGFSANTYPAVQDDWTQNPTKELQAFQQAVGNQKFAAANQDYNQQVNAWLSRTQNDKLYQSLPDAEKKKVITNEKATLKKQVMKQYGFTYSVKRSAPLPKFQ